MKILSRHRGVFALLCLLLLGILVVIISLIKVYVLKIGHPGLYYRVVKGDVITLEYTHSMYGVTVTERLRVKDGYLELFHVKSNDAALEYFGIEGRGENNVKNILKEFTIPADSVGQHKLFVKDHEILLSNICTKDHRIRIGVTKQPLVSYYIDSIWRR